MVFLATLSIPGQEPQSGEPDLSARFVPLELLNQLDLRPPMAGHLRALHTRRTIRTAAYLGNLWRPRRRDELSPVLLKFAGNSAATKYRERWPVTDDLASDRHAGRGRASMGPPAQC